MELLLPLMYLEEELTTMIGTVFQALEQIRRCCCIIQDQRNLMCMCNLCQPFHISHIQTGIADRLCKSRRVMFVDGSLDRFPVIIFYIPGF